MDTGESVPSENKRSSRDEKAKRFRRSNSTNAAKGMISRRAKRSDSQDSSIAKDSETPYVTLIVPPLQLDHSHSLPESDAELSSGSGAPSPPSTCPTPKSHLTPPESPISGTSPPRSGFVSPARKLSASDGANSIGPATGRRMSQSEVVIALPVRRTKTVRSSSRKNSFSQKRFSEKAKYSEKSPRTPYQIEQVFMVHMLDRSVAFKDVLPDVILQEILDDLGVTGAYEVKDEVGNPISSRDPLTNVPHSVFYVPENHVYKGLTNIIYAEGGKLVARNYLFRERSIAEWASLFDFLSCDQLKQNGSVFKAELKRRQRLVKAREQEAKGGKQNQTFIGDMMPLFNNTKQIVFEKDQNNNPQIISAEIDTLIEIMTHPSGFDKEVANDFIMSFEMAITAAELLKKIKTRMENNAKNGAIQRSCISFLRLWVSHRPQLFHDETALMTDLMDFIKAIAEKNQTDTAIMGFNIFLQSLFDGVHAKHTQDVQTRLEQEDLVSAPKPEVLVKRPQDILDVHPIELARQMTLIDFKLFKAIKLSEYVLKDPSKSQNIRNFSERFNSMNRWISTLICVPETPELRALIIEYFVHVAMSAFVLNNYCAVLQIVTAVHSASVERMLYTYDEVDKTILKYLDLLSTAVSFEHSYRNMRNLLAVSDGACVPYLGMYIQDLLFIEEANRDTTLEGMVNFQKHRMSSTSLVELNNFSTNRFSLYPISEVQEILLNLIVLDEDAIYEESLARETKDMVAKLKAKKKK